MNSKGEVDYLWSHEMISDEVWANITEKCNLHRSDDKACGDAMAHDLAIIDPYDMYAPVARKHLTEHPTPIVTV